MSTTLLHISDSHGGLESGLLAPDTELTYNNNEKRTHNLSSTSQWIWECFNKVIVTTNDFAGNDRVIVYHTSEVCHGSTFPDYLYSPWPDHQITIAVKSLAQLRNITNLVGLRFCYGSGAHDYGQQGATKAVADDVAAWGYSTACVDHGHEEIDGCEIDWAHKGPKPGKGLDRATPVRSYVIRCVRSYLERGKRAPDIILRGHWHTRFTDMVKVPWGRDGMQVLMSIGAPLTGPNEYARQFNHVEGITEVGGTLIKVENGRVLDFQPVTFEREDRQRVDGVVCHPFKGPVG